MTKEILIKSALRALVKREVKQGSVGYALEEDSAYEVSWKDVLNWLEQMESITHEEIVYINVDNELNQTVKGMISTDYIERFKAEYKQVVIRAKRLDNIITKATNNEIEFNLDSKLEQLIRQHEIMLLYKSILEDRAKTEGINLD